MRWGGGVGATKKQRHVTTTNQKTSTTTTGNVTFKKWKQLKISWLLLYFFYLRSFYLWSCGCSTPVCQCVRWWQGRKCVVPTMTALRTPTPPAFALPPLWKTRLASSGSHTLRTHTCCLWGIRRTFSTPVCIVYVNTDQHYFPSLFHCCCFFPPFNW